MNLNAKSLLNGAGSLVGLAGVVFVGDKLWEYSDQLSSVRLDFLTYFFLAILAIGYGLSNIFLALAWHHILYHLDVTVIWRWTIRTYALSQLGKYVPGNIFHFAGRQVLGVASGLPNIPLAKSTGLELFLLGLCGLLFAPLLAGWWSGRSGSAVAIGSTAFFAAGVAGFLLVTDRLVGRNIAAASAFHIAFLFLLGLGFAAIMALNDLGSIAFTTVPTVVGAYVLAWLAGLVTPGAPAGLGVREAVLLYLLSGMSGETNILLAVLMGRVMTVGGDLIFYTYFKITPRCSASGAPE